jgi:Fe-S cluster biogenesis protein NfuA
MFIETAATPNPATMKYLPGRPVLPAGTLDFRTTDAARRSPLAARLFAIGSVSRVFLGGDFITVTKVDDIEWQHLNPVVLGVIMEHFVTGDPIVTEAPAEPAQPAETDFEADDAELVAQIKELIETRVRPAAAQAGGTIALRGFRDGVVFVEMEGAGFELIDGVRNMLGHYFPEVTDVRDWRDAKPKPGLETPEGLAIRALLDESVNPAVAAHGGHIALVDVADDTVYIRLEGGCQGCGMADVTLKQGVEVEIRRAVPSIQSVLDVTDHAGGSNPYFQPGKGGAAPF